MEDDYWAEEVDETRLTNVGTEFYFAAMLGVWLAYQFFL